MRLSKQDTGIKGLFSSGMVRLAGSCSTVTAVIESVLCVGGRLDMRRMRVRKQKLDRVPEPCSRMKTGQK